MVVGGSLTTVCLSPWTPILKIAENVKYYVNCFTSSLITGYSILIYNLKYIKNIDEIIYKIKKNCNILLAITIYKWEISIQNSDHPVLCISS